MFDKLIESNAAGAEFKPRRKFFMVSTFIVGTLFVTAVVVSLFAADIDLGTDDFEIATMLPPMETEVPEPDQPRQQPDRPQPNRSNELPMRTEIIARIDETQPAPTTTSVVRNTIPERPIGRYILGWTNVNPPPGEYGTGNSQGVGTPSSSSVASSGESVAETRTETVPPPIRKHVENKRPISKGVINGIAIHLPRPPYPPVAKAANVSGDVNVQVLIDESGNVISAKAIGGPALLRLEAERAAAKAKFKPTYLSDQPVKVTGIIVYKFSRG